MQITRQCYAEAYRLLMDVRCIVALHADDKIVLC